MIRAVFLDIDNTLLDFDETIRESMREGFARLPGIAPEEVMIIGDSLTADMAGGIEYGLQTCWFNRSRMKAPEGTAVTCIVENLWEIRQILC